MSNCKGSSSSTCLPLWISAFHSTLPFDCMLLLLDQFYYLALEESHCCLSFPFSLFSLSFSFFLSFLPLRSPTDSSPSLFYCAPHTNGFKDTEMETTGEPDTKALKSALPLPLSLLCFNPQRKIPLLTLANIIHSIRLHCDVAAIMAKEGFGDATIV